MHLNRSLMILFGLLCIGIFLRYISFSGHLTYVDSYKYIVQVKSFSSENARSYVNESSNPTSKWGFPLVSKGSSTLLKLNNEQLVRFMRVSNIAFSLIIGTLFYLYSRKYWLLSVPFFISPLFYMYSSYIISEFLAISLVMLSYFLVKKEIAMRANFSIQGKSKYPLKSYVKNSYKLILLGLSLGFLPFIRSEMIVFSSLILIYLTIKSKRSGALAGVIGGVFSILLFLSLGLYSNQSFVLVVQQLSIIYLQIILLLAVELLIVVFFLKISSQKLCILLKLLALILVLIPFFSFTFRNVFYMDPLLYIFAFVTIILFSYKQRSLISEVSRINLLILIFTTVIYLIFNRNIDRYGITIFCFFLILIAGLFEDNTLNSFSFKLKGAKQYSVIVLMAIYFTITIAYSIKFPPLPEDFQQYVAKRLEVPVKPNSKLYTSSYLYLPFLYYKNMKTNIADNVKYHELKPGDMVVVDDSLEAVNKDIIREITQSPDKIYINTRLTNEAYFREDDTIVHSGRDILLVTIK